ncbi:retron Ec48 family effector membrane protein [Providencia rettgeri]|uniref:retron Ec48 family effector membrane protein n=1 Tax=Providencia sp. PROV200 TaxID=2936794 RepID=UPI001BD66252|nr:retron Ec48 family effector membrane protein [Providencia rettgeri]
MKIENPLIRVAIYIIAGILVFSVVICVVSIAWTVVSSKLYERGFNLSSHGIDNLYKEIKWSLSIIEVAFWVITTFITVVGVVIALNTYELNANNNRIALDTYQLNAKNTVITNHISHFGMFKDYVNTEINKRDMLKSDKINIFCLYNLMFPKSRSGELNISQDYIEFMSGVEGIINSANNCITSTAGKYNYKVHQRNLIDKFSEAGITLNNGPKNTFISLENEIFGFIDNINSAFSNISINKLSNIPRNYT